MKPSQITVDLLEKVMRSKGYKFFTDHSKPFNLNIIGIRSKDLNANTFNDFITVAFKDENTDKWTLKVYEATTDPGTVFRLKPINQAFGTAIMVPGQYRSTYERGIHARNSKFAHEALRQVEKVAVYRDSDKDKEIDLDPKTIQKGFYGINIHRANQSTNVLNVDYYSAGCQVIRKASDFFEFMQIIRRSEKYWGKRLTYTLLEEDDFIPFL